MDVTFTNVLEGARQYFQGLPTGSNSSLSPAYSSESHHSRHEYDRGIPQSSNNNNNNNIYWSSHPNDAPQPQPPPPARDHAPVQNQREHSVLREHASAPKDHTVIHRPSSHGSDSSSRPPSHHSQYAQSVPVSHEQSRHYYTGSYQDHYQQHLHQQQPVKQQTQQLQQHQHQHQPQTQMQHPTSQPSGHYQQSRQSFEFSRPQARDTPTYSQYQSHAGSPYQQSPSPYHQVPSPQQPRAPSREQMVPRVPSREQTIPRVPSHEQLVPRTREAQPQYSQASSESYYQYYQQPQPKVATSNVSYKQQQYPQQNVYYKHNYGQQQSHQSVFAASRQEDQNNLQHSVRTTHNLPPIAAISHYHSSRVREPNRAAPPTTTTSNRTRTFSSSSHSIPVTSSIIQQNYSNYRTNQCQPITTQSYTNVIMTTTNSSSTNNNYYSQQFQHTGVDNTSRVIVKRESPLDLSVKTVRTPADSTLNDADHKYRLSTHNYPQLDVNSFQRNLTQRSAQLTAATAPKVEFRPNFNVPNLSQTRPEKAHSNNKLAPDNKNIVYRYPTASVPTAAHVNSYIRAAPKMVTSAKRPADIIVPPTVPNKVPKLNDNWRQSIDLKIEEKLSSYKQQQAKLVNGYEKPNYEQHSTYQYQTQSNHVQTYVPSVGTHQYPGYNQTSNCYLQTASRSNSNPSLNTVGNAKNTPGGAVDKRVLNLLRNSLEVKGQKKLEQMRSNENYTARSDIQHPSTDVTAPLQPKPVFVNRNNMSPFTPTSFPENSNMTAAYKYHIPKAVDSINFDINKTNQLLDKQDTVITNHNNVNECDGLAAFLAARIRTKGELKQGGINQKSQLHEVIEKQLKSPIKQDSTYSSSSQSSTPPKLQKERLLIAPAPRKRLFSRTEEDPAREPGLRSSSETSVFDFPDSDSENDNRESLEAMRKCRKSTKVIVDVKQESPPRVPTPGEDMFSQLCDNFLEQLKSGVVVKRKSRKNNDKVAVKIESEVDLTKVKTELELPSIDPDIKQEDLFKIKRKNVRRRILSSSDSSDNEAEKKDKKAEESDSKIKQKEEIKSEIVEEIKSEIVVEEIKTEIVEEKPEPTVDKEVDIEIKSPQKINDLASVIRPSKKPSFGDGSDFYPGWEEGVYEYKKSLRMPPTLIQVTRPIFHRLSTSLPDLDPCPQSPTTSISCDDKPKEKRIKSEPDSDTESNSDFNIFAKKTNYDSEGSSSIKSLPNTGRETSILDRLLEKCGGRKRKKYKRKDDHSPKTVPKAENPVELLPTPSLEIKEEDDKKTKKLSVSPVIKAESPLLEFRKTTMSNFKDAFLKRSLNNQFTTVVLNSRTRRETRVQKQRATIKEVFGEDRPASAPPIPCVNDIQQIKEELAEETNNCFNNLVVRLEKKDNLIERVADLKRDVVDIKKEENKEKQEVIDKKQKDDKEIKASIKTEVEEDSTVDDDTRSLGDITVKSETPSIDGDDGSVSGKKRGKFGKMRRKFSSGFDYIRKKKKVKKETVDNENIEKKKKKLVVSKTLESVDDIQKEIKTWVLNKGIGETHLHRAARLGYTDVTAYCLEKTECPPSPRDNAGYTPLHWACSKGHLQIAKLLLLYGANPSESAQGGIRPLHEAVENGFVEIARLLLSYGADPTLATYSGLTPLALTNDEVTKDFLMNHLNDIEGEVAPHWISPGPASIFDAVDQIGFNVLDNAPSPDPEVEEEDIDFEMSESLLPNLYTLCNESPTDRWVLLQDLSTILKIKSRDALLKQICPPSTSGGVSNHKNIIRELRMPEFLDQARCCQFLNAGEKINTRATKIALVKYTDKVRDLLNIESVVITAR